MGLATWFQARNRFEGTRSEVEELMNKTRRNPQEHKRANHFTMEGYLYVQEKSKLCCSVHLYQFG